MIADLKADSARWDAERRANAQNGQSGGVSFRDSDGIVRRPNHTIVQYRESTTHQHRQYYGPTSETASVESLTSQPSAFASTGYVSSTQPSYAQPGYAQTSYSQPYSSPILQDGSNYYAAGAYMADQALSPAARVSDSQAPLAGSNVQHTNTPAYYPQQPSWPTYYSSQPGVAVASSPQYSTQPMDPYYGRGKYNTEYPWATFLIMEGSNNLLEGRYDTQDLYSSRGYEDSPALNRNPGTAPLAVSAATTSSSRRDREADSQRRRDDRERRRR
jgi:hypothetical protein